MKIPFHNEKNHAVFMGGVMVPPGETRLVDESLLAPTEVIAQEEVAKDPLALLLDGKVADVVAKLPDLSSEELERLGDLEQLGQQRKGILSVIAEKILSSASAAQGSVTGEDTEKKDEVAAAAETELEANKD